jgi:hypothetical protein
MSENVWFDIYQGTLTKMVTNYLLTGFKTEKYYSLGYRTVKYLVISVGSSGRLQQHSKATLEIL